MTTTTTTEYGDITMNDGTIVHLTEAAEAGNYHGYGDVSIRYSARGVDGSGNVYRVKWDTTEDWDAKIADGYEPNGDYEDACDWDSPTEVTREN